MIAQNQQKVKKEITWIVQKAGESLSVPEKKFALEIMTGIYPISMVGNLRTRPMFMTAAARIRNPATA